jgi:hypothetical protein
MHYIYIYNKEIFQDGGPPPRPSNSGKTLIKRPPDLISFGAHGHPKIGQRSGLTERRH